MATSILSFYSRKPTDTYDYSQAKSTPGVANQFTSPVSSAKVGSSNYWLNAYQTPTPTPVRTPQQNNASTIINDAKKLVPGAYKSNPANPWGYVTPAPVLSTDKANKPVTTPAGGVTPNALDELVSRYRQIAADRAKLITQRRDEDVVAAQQQQAAREKALADQTSRLGGIRDKSIARINESIPNQEAITGEYKQQLEDQYGQQNKTDIQLQREEQGNLQNLFGGLGTIDSSVFQTQAANSQQRLTGKLSQSAEQKRIALVQADRDLKDFKSQAQQLIDNETVKFDDAIMTISQTFAQGTQEFNQAVLAAYRAAQDEIYKIEGSVTDKEMEYQTKLAEAGIKNAADLETKAKAAQQIEQTKGLITEVLSRDLEPVTGLMRVRSYIQGTDAYTTKQKLDEIKAQLKLAARGQLKGQGQVSDMETKMLGDAVAALDAGQSADAIKAELNKIYNQLGQMPSMQGTSLSTGNDFSSSLQPGETAYYNPQSGDVIAITQGEAIPAGFVKM